MCSLFVLPNHSLKAERKIIKEIKNINSFDCLINSEIMYFLFEKLKENNYLPLILQLSVFLFLLLYYSLKAESKIIK